MQIDLKMNEYETTLMDMGQKVYHAMEAALKSLEKGDKEKALQVIEMDEFINLEEASINTQAVEILSLLQPVARDLRYLIAGIKVATDFERIGDYAKGIGRFVIRSSELNQELAAEIMVLGQLFLHNFSEVLAVLKSLDVKEAYRVAGLDDRLDEGFKKLIQKLAEGNETIPFSVETASMIRNIERAGDHSKNICEQVIYITRGQHIDLG